MGPYQCKGIVDPSPTYDLFYFVNNPTIHQQQQQHDSGTFQVLGGGLTNQHENEFNSSIIPKASSCALNNNEYIDELKKTNFFESIPPGYRFCPRDLELIIHFLDKKVRSEELPPNKIQEVNLYLYNPEQLIANHPFQGEKEWFFFTPRYRRYKNGTRPNRAAGDGYRKVNGTEKCIIDNGLTVGFRNSLIYCSGKHPKGTRTKWHMHEFRLNEPPRLRSGVNDMRLDDCVVCRVYEKEEKAKTTPARVEPNGKPLEGEA